MGTVITITKGKINDLIKTVSNKKITKRAITTLFFIAIHVISNSLAAPDKFIEIERPKTCIVEYVDIDGKKKNMECDGLLSTCIQHEINHLDGKLIIDFLSKLKKDLIIKKLSKTKRNTDRIIV